MSRMFLIEGKPMRTWNVFVGCEYECTYCNARKMALTRLKGVPRYRDGFIPHFVIEELYRQFRAGDFVFVAYMGDISFADKVDIDNILSSIRVQPKVNFLFCSKNPAIYSEWGFRYPPNLYLGATIETCLNYGLTKAPSPRERYTAMRELKHDKKFISVEPVMSFSTSVFLGWMEEIKPEIVEIGPDNYHNNLSEPAGWQVRALLDGLRQFCPTVVEKPGLERLKGIS